MPRIDLTGLRFGRLVVEGVGQPYINHKTGAKQKRWLCRCDCGNTKNIPTACLTHGASRSCGCYNREAIHERCFEDLTGQRFGMLTVVYQAANKIRSGKKRVTWHCQCDCGNETDVVASELKSGHTKSCGCQQYNVAGHNFCDLTGRRFGKLTAIRRDTDRVKPSGNSITRWICRCDCGSEKSIDAYNLTSGRTKSCGCTLSFGEETVAKLLSQKCVRFARGYRFNDLLSSRGNPLMFDFALINQDGSLNSLVEYQGMQHYAPDEQMGDFGRLQRNETDQSKKDYCASHNIPLYEIRYDDNIEDKLNQILGIAYEDTVPSAS